MTQVTLHTGPGVFEVLSHVCRNPQEALKQFVENAADAIEEINAEEGQVLLKLKYQTKVTDGVTSRLLKGITVQDNGVGMDARKMRQVLHQIGSSEKLNSALRGEQGIGLLAFALISDELHLASTDEDGKPSSCLVLKRRWLKNGYAEILKVCHKHEHTQRGTIAHLDGILPEIAPQLSKEKIKDYLGQQFASDLRSNLYAMAISDDDIFEQVHPQRFRGVKIMGNTITVAKAGSAYVEFYVLPWDMADASISLYGRGGTRICDLTDLQAFKVLPWIDRRLEGYIRYDRLKRTADKTALIQDQVFNNFVQALREMEPKVMLLIQEVSAESQERRFGILLNRAGRLIDRFLRYREKGLLENLSLGPTSADLKTPAEAKPGENKEPSKVGSTVKITRAPTRAPHIKIAAPSSDKSVYRSWYDPKEGMICINREHTEFLLSQREDRRCMRYLFYVWAKETMLQEYGEQAQKVADEMVGLLAEAEPLLR
ncbi:MAG: ATP-binding protein [Dehalococcoidales bacterium]|nr:ATP-binding protein [Dehalococcoidales bacterium]